MTFVTTTNEDHKFNNNEKRAPESSVAPTTSSATVQEPADTLVLPDLRFSYRKRWVLGYLAFLVFCNVVIPCVLFYPLNIFTRLSTKEQIGISSAALGISSCFDGPFRLFRLVKHRKIYGPLGSDTWWHLDFVMWTYTIAMIVFAFPLAIAPAIPLYNWFLVSTMMLVAPVGIIFFLSLLAIKVPWRISSEEPGTRTKPAVLYVIEDVGAVDFKHGREFRRRVHDRYNVSPPFRLLMTELTIYWTCATLVYCGITSAVTWASPLGFAFGWVLGQFFLWGIASAIGNWFVVKRGLRREKEWWKHQGRSVVKHVDTKPEIAHENNAI